MILQEPSTVSATVSGQGGALTPVCFDDTGTVSATGSGNGATWPGSLQCPAVTILACSTVTLAWTSPGATLSADATTLDSQVTGQMTG